MKIKYPTSSIFIFLVIIILSGCHKSYLESCNSISQVTVTNVEGISVGYINSLNEFQVYFNTYNGCGQFSHFEETSNGNTRNIKVIAKYIGCVCNQAFRSIIESYHYTVTQPGTYIFNFMQPDNTYITRIVTVN